jgi:hypothetical protein
LIFEINGCQRILKGKTMHGYQNGVSNLIQRDYEQIKGVLKNDSIRVL